MLRDPRVWAAVVALVSQAALYLIHMDLRLRKLEEAIERRLGPVEEDFSRRYAPQPRGE